MNTHRSIFSAALISLGSLFSVGSLANPATAFLMVELGKAQAVLAPGSGTTTASFEITFSNSLGTDAPLAGYTLFLDIGPLGLGLPAGVTFADPAATYFAGTGVGADPLPLAGNPGTINLTPAAGDLGLGQVQSTNGMLGPNESFVMLQVNLIIDRAVASPGVHDILLNLDGENSLDVFDGGGSVIQQTFTVTNGTLTISAVPEPGAWLLLLVASGICMGAARVQKRRVATGIHH